VVAIQIENSGEPSGQAGHSGTRCDALPTADSAIGTASSSIPSIPIEEGWALVDGHRMRYLHAGSGPPLLLIHGLLGYSYSWRYNWAALGQQATVYAVDLLGTGFSERPPQLDCNVAAIARRMVAFLDAVGVDAADVLGTSHGGGVAMMLAATMPQRVRRLILAAPVNPWSSHGRFRTWILSSALGAWALRRMFRFLPPVHNRFLRQMYPEMVSRVLDEIQRMGGSVEYEEKTGLILVNGEFTASLVLVRCAKTAAGSFRWNIRLDTSRGADLTIALRMDADNKKPFDYYLLPTIDMTQARLRLAEENAFYLDAYRFETLEFLYEMARRSRIEEIA
jgi:pimeloyl-ACP methyl ester carboxylesterase